MSILNFVHSKNICHLDISPQNFLLRSLRPELVLCDFNSAREISDEEEVGEILENLRDSDYSDLHHNIHGRLEYASPEMLCLGRDASGFSSDLYSFGCLLYELVHNYPPFHSSQDRVRDGLNKNFRFEETDDYSSRVRVCCGKLLSLKPEERRRNSLSVLFSTTSEYFHDPREVPVAIRS